MSAGHMLMRLRLVVLLALLAGPVGAEPAGCPALADTLQAVTGYRVTAPVAGPEGGWCVFDRAVLRAEGAVSVAAERLRLRGGATDGAVTVLEVEAGGLKIAPGLGQRDRDAVLQETLRLQTFDLSFALHAGSGELVLKGGRLRLSGGTELAVEADIAGAGLDASAMLTGRLTRLDLDWRNDGKLLRPVMQAWGEGLVDGAEGGAAVDAARLAVQHIVRNLPASLFPGDGQEVLDTTLEALPQGRGRLRLEFRAPEGIGAAQVAIAAFSGDPLGPEALARLFGGAQVVVDWQPGIAP